MSACTCPLRRLSCLPARLRDQRGQAVVEFAIVLPILMLLVLGIIFFGRYENDSSQATSLAELGARDAAINFAFPYSASGGSGNYTSFANFIQGQATGELNGTSDVSQVGISVQCYTSGSASACPAQLNSSASYSVSVCVRTTVQFPFLGHGATLQQKATMRLEQGQTPAASTGTANAGTGLNAPSNGFQTSSNPSGPTSC